MSVDAILKEIESLTVAERAELKARLSEQFPEEIIEPEMSPELAQLLDERNAAADANPTAGYTMEEVIAYVNSKAELERRVDAADAHPERGIPWEVVYEESLKRARK